QPGIDNTLPGQPGRPNNDLPSQTYWVIVWVPGYGYRYVAVDPSLKPDQGLPGQGGRPSNELPGNQPGMDNTLPGGRPNRPSNELPPTPQTKVSHDNDSACHCI